MGMRGRLDYTSRLEGIGRGEALAQELIDGQSALGGIGDVVYSLEDSDGSNTL